MSDTSIVQVRPSLPLSVRVRDFYELTKPRMNFLILVMTATGFYMGAWADTSWMILAHTLLGTALTAAGAGTLNQYIEREYDKLMPRTKNRPLAAGRVMPGEALFYGVALAIAGIGHLAYRVNLLTASLSAFTLLSYLFLYTPAKRRTTLNTIIGAVPGAIPPVMGWTAATGHIDERALSLFGILFMWQLPHFLAIAILYHDDYKAGGFKMLPVSHGMQITGRQIIVWGLALIPVSVLPSALGLAGAVYFVAAILLGIIYLSFGITCAATHLRGDARKLFFASIIYLPVLVVFLMLDKR